MALFGSRKGNEWWLEVDKAEGKVLKLTRRLEYLESGKFDIQEEIRQTHKRLVDAKLALREIKDNYYD
ncbi:MAG TPA: hypothetical protein PLW50_00395 [Smithellaceae bacterium]|nr:hypothetical protein [Smithellaceae bacterium]